MFLRQSTASQEILLGPFVDVSDGDTPMTSLTIGNTDITLFKHGASAKVSKNSGGATHDAAGDYVATLDATDTNTLGNLEVTCHVATALAVRRTYVVLPAEVFDTMVLGAAIADSTQAIGTRPTVFQALLGLWRLWMTKRTLIGSLIRVFKEDHSATAFEITTDHATTPTDFTRTT
jgi:hypothetical protein